MVYDECLFCGKKIKGTPRMLAGEKGLKWQENWLKHISDHLMAAPKTPENVEGALWSAMSVAREFDRNK
jgi:hypothetical protein